jgi:hypothetical protein
MEQKSTTINKIDKSYSLPARFCVNLATQYHCSLSSGSFVSRRTQSGANSPTCGRRPCSSSRRAIWHTGHVHSSGSSAAGDPSSFGFLSIFDVDAAFLPPLLADVAVAAFLLRAFRAGFGSGGEDEGGTNGSGAGLEWSAGTDPTLLRINLGTFGTSLGTDDSALPSIFSSRLGPAALSLGPAPPAKLSTDSPPSGKLSIDSPPSETSIDLSPSGTLSIDSPPAAKIINRQFKPITQPLTRRVARPS